MPTTLERLSEAVNSHDAERMATLFAEDYASSQPVHPGRGFGGRAQVAKNWTAIFRQYRTSPPRWCPLDHRQREWGEWDWHGRYRMARRLPCGRNDHGDPDGLMPRHGSTWSPSRRC